MCFRKVLFLLSYSFIFIGQSSVIASESELDETVFRDIESKVTIIVATALGSEDSDKTGESASAKATGFFVSKNGQLITSYHILSKLKKELGDYDEETLQFFVYQGSTLAQKQWSAFKDSFDPKLDLLSLNVQVGGGGVDYFKYDPQIENKIKLSSTNIHTYGYPEGHTYQTDKGIIKSFEGPVGNEYLWTTNMEFKNGQSGSPIFLSNGKLLGLVKGAEKGFPKNNFFVPVASIDNLLGGRLEREGKTIDGSTSAPSIGKIKVVAKLRVTEPRERQMKRSFSERNSHCSRNRDIVWHVKASEGWKIDPNTIITKVNKSSKSHFRGVTSANEEGFYITGALRNNGECIKVFGKVAGRDGRGLLSVQVSYKEVQSEMVDKDFELLVKSVHSGELIERKMPESTFSVVTYFETTAGKVVTNQGEGEFTDYSVSLNKQDGINISTIKIK